MMCWCSWKKDFIIEISWEEADKGILSDFLGGTLDSG